MFSVGDKVKIKSDGRIGRIVNTDGPIDPVNGPVVENCLVRFDSDITKQEWFKPEELCPV